VNHFPFFGQIVDFWLTFRFLTKISIFGQIVDFWLTFRFLTKISTRRLFFDFFCQKIKKKFFKNYSWNFDQRLIWVDQGWPKAKDFLLDYNADKAHYLDIFTGCARWDLERQKRHSLKLQLVTSDRWIFFHFKINIIKYFYHIFEYNFFNTIIFFET